MIASHAHQKQTDNDDQSVEASVEIPSDSDNEYADITRILMVTTVENETARGAQSSSLNPQEINTPSPSGGPLFTIFEMPTSFQSLT